MRGAVVPRSTRYGSAFMNILMVAAEDDGLAPVNVDGTMLGAKVGGIGDVVRDVPPALALEGCRVATVIPSYGYLHTSAVARKVAAVAFRFRGNADQAEVYEVPGRVHHRDVAHLVIDHPSFVSKDRDGKYEIFHPDPDSRPFASDASKYARFCVAVAQAIKEGVFGALDVIHLHDWHAALFLLLRRYHASYQDLQRIRVVFTIHNLALQGVRPIANDESALEAWFPDLKYDRDMLVDPRWSDCENPMEIGIRFSDAVHAVSPSYAEEILQPSDEPRFFGGEGLESYLRQAKREGRLHGILNGCEYPADRQVPRLSFTELLHMLRSAVSAWSSRPSSRSPAHAVALQRLDGQLASRQSPEILLTSVSRVTEQKTFLLCHPGSSGKSALESLLAHLGARGLCILLGTGSEEYERFLVETSKRHANFVFLSGFSNDCATALYANGDLFLMPSSFEPCGISQMLAMRDGQPCVVHSVGGLRDTVIDGVNGFEFGGGTAEQQVDNFVEATLRAIRTKQQQPDAWQEICRRARDARFRWRDIVRQYMDELYTSKPPR